MSGAQEGHPAYRRDIDGLRAVAVLSVVLYHAFPQGLRGGFVGVDIFFVISGYLISGILFRKVASGRFSYTDFYDRRIRRLFPALLLVMASVLVFGVFCLLPDELMQLGRHAVAGGLFYSNIAHYLDAGYFDAASEVKPLLHLWSLGVEEQFYIFWPVILLLGKRHGGIGRLLVVSFLFSFAWALLAVFRDRTFAFYMPFTRFWELMAGTVLAYIELNPWANQSNILDRFRGWKASLISGKAFNDLLSVTGLLMIILALALLKPASLFPGLWAVLPVAGAVFLIAAGQDAIINRGISSRVMVWFGLISYPLYLWHWPLFSYLHIVEMGKPQKLHVVLALGLSVLLAWLTYRFVELRLRHSEKRLVPVLVAGMIVVVVSGGMVAQGVVGSKNSSPGLQELVRASGEWDFPGKRLQAFDAYGRTFYQAGVGANEVLFIGDSNMEQYAPRVVTLFERGQLSGYKAVFATASGCLPVPGVRRLSETDCEESQASIHHYLQAHAVSKVVIAAQWIGYLAGGSARGDFVVEVDGRSVPLEAEVGQREVLNRLQGFIHGLRQRNLLVTVILNIPVGAAMSPRSMFRRGFFGVERMPSEGIALETLLAGYGPLRKELIAVARREGATIIDPVEYLCDVTYCPAMSADGFVRYKDEAHLRPSFVRQHADYVDQVFSK